jgi:hypothetical protein
VAPDPLAAAKGEFQTRTTELDGKSRECVTKFNELITKVNKALNDVSWFTNNVWFLNDEVDKLRALAESAGRKITEMQEKIAKVVRGSYPVLSLYDAALRWSGDIQAPVSATSGVVSAPAMLSMRGQWEGPAALSYFTVVVPAQAKAVDGVSTVASSTSKWLAEVGTSNLKFMLEMLEPVAEVLEKIVAGLAAAASVAGLLEAIGRIADALGESLSAIITILTGTAAKIGETIKQAIDAYNITNDNTPFPKGHWPDSVTI